MNAITFFEDHDKRSYYNSTPNDIVLLVSKKIVSPYFRNMLRINGYGTAINLI